MSKKRELKIGKKTIVRRTDGWWMMSGKHYTVGASNPFVLLVRFVGTRWSKMHRTYRKSLEELNKKGK